MIVVALMGGMGNQMFQYAAALRLAKRHRTKLALDLTFLRDRAPRENVTLRDFDLGVFGLEGPVATPAELRRFGRSGERSPPSISRRVLNRLRPAHIHHEKRPGFDPAVLNLPDNTYLEGYFQNERYFAEIAPVVRERFQLQPDERTLLPSTRELARRIREAANSICVNVRRGDYVSNPVANRYLGVCGMAYFDRALAWLHNRGLGGPVFVFSDDAGWAQNHFGTRPNTIIVSDEHAGPRFATKLWLMTVCRNFVIPNSSFGWWAAWLAASPDKTVLCPARWFQAEELGGVEICPDSWIRIDNT